MKNSNTGKDKGAEVEAEIVAEKYVSPEIPMTKGQKERFIKEAIALRRNLALRQRQQKKAE